jgi:hypothetical protein
VTAVPDEVIALADERVAARAAKDWARSDALRDQIAALGFVVADGPDGYRLSPRPPFEVLATVRDLPQGVGAHATCVVAVLIDGRPEDTETCLSALIAHLPEGVTVLGIDLGDVDGAGHVLHDTAVAHPDRVVELHVFQTLAQAGWGPTVTSVLETCASPLVSVMDMSTVLDGDALSPILAEFEEGSVVASGWRGVDVDLADNWRGFIDAMPGEVDAMLGYLIVVRRDAALASPPHPKAKFYRNADMEWSLAMRAAGGRIVMPQAVLPVHQERHHGYHDSDPEFRDRESRKTYDRLLQRFRGTPGILRPRD